MRRTDGQPEPSGEGFQFVEDGHEISIEGATLRLVLCQLNVKPFQIAVFCSRRATLPIMLLFG